MRLEAADEIERLRAVSDQLAAALRERESSHYSWCPRNDSDEIAKSLWPDGCPLCAALAAYDAARKEADHEAARDEKDNHAHD
jgi:hypothetical protein